MGSFYDTVVAHSDLNSQQPLRILPILQQYDKSLFFCLTLVNVHQDENALIEWAGI